jgi:AraC-like DNA-binding protein
MEGYFPISRAPRITAIKAYILAEIANPDLCLAAIAAEQGISSSYVRKLFAAEGTKFTAYVLETRLQNVCRMLTDPDSRIHSVSAIAMMCGFNDVSYFNRAFRKRYGCTPSALRGGRGLSLASTGQPMGQQSLDPGLGAIAKAGIDQR